ncbi:DUF1254 domain-containing protein [Agromyces sp. NPDC058064]|uniref:DUF1254 domain-containing protein n=1 Tax=Agromyces sp. NPDC058064 TaxID=3346322 RepID=UPI0036D93916
MADAALVELASKAYLYGFPIVFDLEQVDRYVSTGVGANPAAALNSFSHARTLTTAEDTFVSINNDTVYSIANVDLSVGPVRFSVPDAGDRYYVMQFVDAWTNNFAYVGKRATGTSAREFLLLPPDWDGEVDGDATPIRFPTRIASIVGRWACDGEADLPAVHALQDATTLTPVLRSLVPPVGLPATGPGPSDALDFFERFRVYSQAFPPAERDAALQASFAPLGLTGQEPVGSLDDDVTSALELGFAEGRKVLEQILHSNLAPVVNGWQLTYHVFDYNLDFFEVGAIDDDAWKIADPKVRIAQRAAAARAGLWGNHAYEAAYVMTYVDAAGEPLDGARNYTLRFSPTPPVGAFWSVTMYDVPDFYLVDNEIDRYSIGDRTPGVVRDADGGVTITMSSTRPVDPTAAANWLPTPTGAFRPLLRMYMPDESVLDGGYVLPAIERS